METYMCWKREFSFGLVAPHPAPPSGKKMYKLWSSTQAALLHILRIRSDLGREWYDRSYHPLSEVPWATSFCGRRSHTTLVASPMTVIIMHQVQRMIDHMELEPVCLAPLCRETLFWILVLV